MTLSLAVLVAIVFGLAPSAGVQSLGEAARREKERRAADSRKEAKVFNDDDLAARRSGLPPSPRAAASPAAPEPPDESQAGREEREREWRRRFADARERIRGAEERAWREVIEPVLSPAGVYVSMRVRKFVETEELRAARKALEDLEDELRRAGRPAGWGRE